MSNFGDSPDIGDSPDRSGINSGNNLSTSVDSEETALSKYEHELERMINESLVNGQDLSTQKLFIAFQNAAKAVTKMFRGKFKKILKIFHNYIPVFFFFQNVPMEQRIGIHFMQQLDLLQCYIKVNNRYKLFYERFHLFFFCI